LGSGFEVIPDLVRASQTACPIRRPISKPLDADAAGQATFHGRFDKIGGEEAERDGHVDPSAALFASAKLCDGRHST
jgi:hypothetical protein